MLSILGAVATFHLVSVPYEGGANQRGSAGAVDFLLPRLEKRLTAHTKVDVGAAPVSAISGALCHALLPMLGTSTVPIVLGGDHTVAVGSVGASQAHCLAQNATLGVLWIDAHADFNTMESSPTRNLHGMPVAILCGHTLPEVRGELPALKPGQFAYLGVRDVDPLERDRMCKYGMRELAHADDVEGWMDSVDRVHVSLDVDSIYHRALAVNTPVAGGLPMDVLLATLRLARRSGKLLCADVVEFNPTVGDASFTARLIEAMIATMVDAGDTDAEGDEMF